MAKMLQSIIIVENKKYMSAKCAAEIWKLNPSTVRDYCRNKKIPDAFKVSDRNWYIPIDSIKPLSDSEIHKLLVLTLQLKNRPSLEIDWAVLDFDTAVIIPVYTNLYKLGYIELLPKCQPAELPYKIVLTQKGLESATHFRKAHIPAFETVLSTWVPIFFQVAQFTLEIYKLTQPA